MKKKVIIYMLSIDDGKREEENVLNIYLKIKLILELLETNSSI